MYFVHFQILMSVQVTHVKMVVPVLTVWISIHVNVRLGLLGLIVKSVRIKTHHQGKTGFCVRIIGTAKTDKGCRQTV